MDAPKITGASSPSALDGMRRRRPQVALAVAGSLLVVLSGCSGDPEESAVTVAQAQVSAKPQSTEWVVDRVR